MTTADEFIAACSAEVGYKESPAGSNRTKFAAEAGHPNGRPWCATFLVAIARRTSLDLPSTSPYTPAMASAFQKAGRWHHKPQRGDFVFFDFPDDVRRVQHVGVLTRVLASGDIETIDGNTGVGNDSNGGQVMRRVRSTRHVVGYGRPAYYIVPNPPPVVYRWSDEGVQMLTQRIPIELDSQGRGNERSGIPAEKFVAVHAEAGVVPNTDGWYPGDPGRPKPEAWHTSEDGQITVIVIGGHPAFPVGVWLTTRD